MADWTKSAAVQRLAAPERKALLEEVSELILLSVRARLAAVRQAKSDSVRRAALEDGLRQLAYAERCDPSPSAALYEDRSRYLAKLGYAGRFQGGGSEGGEAPAAHRPAITTCGARPARRTARPSLRRPTSAAP